MRGALGIIERCLLERLTDLVDDGGGVEGACDLRVCSALIGEILAFGGPMSVTDVHCSKAWTCFDFISLIYEVRFSKGKPQDE